VRVFGFTFIIIVFLLIVVLLAIFLLTLLGLFAKGSLLSIGIDFHLVRSFVSLFILGTRSGLSALSILAAFVAGKILLAGSGVLCGIVGVISLRHGWPINLLKWWRWWWLNCG
jgi:hypothetical protein